MRTKITIKFMISLFLSLGPLITNAQSQQTLHRDSLLFAAREIMTSQPFCALVSVDSAGQPQIRTMNPFPQGNDFTVWFATSRNSEKVKEIRKEPRVCVYYADHKNAQGYVNLMGNAIIIDDKELLKKMKREYWNGIRDWENIFVLIKITPVKMEVVNYKRGVYGNPGAPFVEFEHK